MGKSFRQGLTRVHLAGIGKCSADLRQPQMERRGEWGDLPLAKEPVFNARAIATLLEATLFPAAPWTCTSMLAIEVPATFVAAGGVVKLSFVPAVPAVSLFV